jgi:hypothetical protein
MLELAILMVNSNNKEKADRDIKLAFRVILAINITIFAIMTYLSIKFMFVMKNFYANCTIG